MARDALPQAQAPKTDAKIKPASKKKSPPKINDLMLSV